MSETHLVPCAFGVIVREWIALEGGTYSLVVEEEGSGMKWLVLYVWDGGWERNGAFQMGCLDDYEEEVSARLGRVVDVGECNTPGSDEILVVEQGNRGFWLVLYEWSHFWEFWRFEVSYYVSTGRYLESEEDEETSFEGDDSNVEEEIVRMNGLDEEEMPSLSDHDYQEL
jgi:hypothetical protein